MKTPFLHPALLQLLRCQMLAALRRHLRLLRSGQRPLRTLLIVGLSVVWLCGIVAGMMLRDPLSVVQLRNSITIGMAVYLAWNFIQSAVKRPEHDLVWSAAERRALVNDPFSRSELMRYQVASALTTTVIRALCLSLMLIRDLPNWPWGVLAILLAMSFVELIRMSVQIATHACSDRFFLAYRGVVLLSVVGMAIGALTTAASVLDTPNSATVSPVAWIVSSSLAVATEIGSSSLFQLCEAPFLVFANLATATSNVSWEFLASLVIAVGELTTAICLPLLLDRHFERRSKLISALPKPVSAITGQSRADSPTMTKHLVSNVARCGGIGTLFWRQWCGARDQFRQLLLLCVAPAAVSLSPLLIPHHAATTFTHVVGILGLLTFLLLAATVKFDFRRDFDQLALLKMLPFRPIAMVLGQLTVPVLIVSSLQVMVLIVAACCLNLTSSPLHVMGAIALLLPWIILAFSLDNIFFLLAPTRDERHGIEMFLRTTLTFTAKTITLAICVLVLLVCSYGAGEFCRSLDQQHGVIVSRDAIFLLGVWTVTVSAAGVSLWLLTQIFDRLDPQWK